MNYGVGKEQKTLKVTREGHSVSIDFAMRGFFLSFGFRRPGVPGVLRKCTSQVVER